jgi:hypothetical protein
VQVRKELIKKYEKLTKYEKNLTSDINHKSKKGTTYVALNRNNVNC